ncbi:MAG TPA: hypothetical protein VJP79_00680 [Nitrososphaera sp.]|nr:hypothetical protein [Nitrososphaera sp.]
MAFYQHDLEATDKDPLPLRGFAQAMFICECLCRGEEQEELVAKFKGDAQLVDMWISFLKHNRWLDYDTYAQRWSMTSKGRHRALEMARRDRAYND